MVLITQQPTTRINAIIMFKYNPFTKLQCGQGNMQIRQSMHCLHYHLLALYKMLLAN